MISISVIQKKKSIHTISHKSTTETLQNMLVHPCTVFERLYFEQRIETVNR